MRTTSRELSSAYSGPLAVWLLLLLALTLLCFLGGARLFEPNVMPNRGLAAYEPPPGTRLIPLPHKMDAPELAALPPVAAEPEPIPDPTPVKVAERKPAPAKAKAVRKRPKVRPQERRYPANAYADSRWGGWDNGWGGGRSWGGGWNNRW
jgi:hypothetical protein